ncbi:MAG TPA: GAF domain-containing protein, partial [Capillimicrobium sp.]
MPGPLRSLAPALIATAAVTSLDLAVGSTSLMPLLVVGPLLAAATTGPRGTALVGGLAVLAAIGVGIALDDLATTTVLVALSTVVLGAVLATVIAAAREGERSARLVAERQRAHADLLARAGALFEAGGDPLQHLDELTALPVPALTDICVVDLIGDDGALRAAGAASRAEGADATLRRTRLRHPVPSDAPHPVAQVARTGEPLLLRTISREQLDDWATAPEHREVMRRLDYRTAIIVPLTARGRLIGTLALVGLAGRPAFDDEDLAVALDLARRTGLAIDHARLGSELAETEEELRAMLGAVAEAVTVQDGTGRLVYANEAAARLNGFASVRELVETPLERFTEQWDVRDERGELIAPARFPGRQALAGVAEPEPLLCELVHRETGERRWRLTKATPVLGPDGAPRLAVNVIEDVTEQRRRELGQ